MSSRHHKVSSTALLSLMLLAGLLVPGRSAPPDPPLLTMLLASTQIPAQPISSCQAVRRELRFGWIEAGDESQLSGHLPQTGTPICLAVYRVGAER